MKRAFAPSTQIALLLRIYLLKACYDSLFFLLPNPEKVNCFSPLENLWGFGAPMHKGEFFSSSFLSFISSATFRELPRGRLSTQAALMRQLVMLDDY